MDTYGELRKLLEWKEQAEARISALEAQLAEPLVAFDPAEIEKPKKRGRSK